MANDFCACVRAYQAFPEPSSNVLHDDEEKQRQKSLPVKSIKIPSPSHWRILFERILTGAPNFHWFLFPHHFPLFRFKRVNWRKSFRIIFFYGLIPIKSNLIFRRNLFDAFLFSFSSLLRPWSCHFIWILFQNGRISLFVLIFLRFAIWKVEIEGRIFRKA